MQNELYEVGLRMELSELLSVSLVLRFVPPQLLPTPLSCCHVARDTWEGPAFTTPGSQRRSLV